MSEYITVKIPKELADKIDKLLELRIEGFRSRGEFVTTAIREKLRQYEDELRPRFEHFNVYEDHITIWDNKLWRLIDVYIRDRGLVCEYCESDDCEHTRFVLSIPKVVRALREHGWIIKDGRVVHIPP